MPILPFNFDVLPEGNCFVSNAAGFHTYLSKESLINLVYNGSTGSEEIDGILESKLFLTPGGAATSAASLASASAKRILASLSFRPIFMVVPTLRCDHTCTYCQVSRERIDAKNADLSVDTIPNIVSTIRKLSSPPFKIELQGGEPLLRFDFIQALFAECERVIGNTEFELVIATSLSLVTDEIISWAEGKPVIFSTSLDGSELVHNKNRILTGRNSYSLVAQNIRKIKERLGEGRVSTVTTVTRDSLKEPQSLLKAHQELGISDLFVRPISPYGFVLKGSSSDYSIQQYMSFYTQLIEEIALANKNGASFVEHSAAIHIKRLLIPNFTSYADLKSPSGVLLNCVLFNYDGKIYGSDEARMLQKTNPDMNFSIGSFNAERTDFENQFFYEKIISESFNDYHPGCNSCAYQPFCGSDPCHHVSTQGEMIGDKSLSFFCSYHKSMFQLLVSELSKKSFNSQMLRDWCNA